MNKKFRHPKHIFNDVDAEEIVPFLVNTFNPKSVIDVGCGLGTWLAAFKRRGINHVLGIDGAYHEKEQIAQYLSDSEFFECDLEKVSSSVVSSVIKRLDTSIQSFDLCLSLEVAEHLKESSADSFVTFLTSLSDCIVFSAAIPYQGGDGHVNLQWPDYWVKKFEQRGFIVLDVIRPLFWNNPNIKYWYKQNMLLFIRENRFSEIISLINNQQIPLNIVHPDLYIGKNKYYRNKFKLLFLLRDVMVKVLKICRGE